MFIFFLREVNKKALKRLRNISLKSHFTRRAFFVLNSNAHVQIVFSWFSAKLGDKTY